MCRVPFTRSKNSYRFHPPLSGVRFLQNAYLVLSSNPMRTALSPCLLVFSLVSGCGMLPDGSSMDRTAAQKLSDSYMSDLVADRVDLALDKMEPQFLQSAGGKTKAEAAVRELFNYCGRPLESELRHEETGFFAAADGRRLAMRAFFYSGKTTLHPKGFCFFAVRVVPGDHEMKVAGFGPLKLMSGKLPQWAR